MMAGRNSQNDDDSCRARLGAALAAVALAFTLTACSKPAPQPAAPPAESAAAVAQTAAVPAEKTAEAPMQEEMPGMDHSAAPHPHPAAAAHQDHESKHGGDFFMALDEKHHLEGILVEPDTFRVYMFDEYSKPLSKADVAKADGKVAWGKADNAPETALKPSADGLTLEAKSPSKLTFPTELTLRIRFPGAAAGSRPELFTFPFKAYTHDPTTHKH